MKVSLLFGLLLASASVQAQTTFTVDGTQYKVTGSNTVELVKGDTKATEVVIPASVTYQPASILSRQRLSIMVSLQQFISPRA